MRFKKEKRSFVQKSTKDIVLKTKLQNNKQVRKKNDTKLQKKR